MTTQTVEAQVINAQAINDDELEQLQGGLAFLLTNPIFMNGMTQGLNTAIVEHVRDEIRNQ